MRRCSCLAVAGVALPGASEGVGARVKQHERVARLGRARGRRIERSPWAKSLERNHKVRTIAMSALFCEIWARADGPFSTAGQDHMSENADGAAARSPATLRCSRRLSIVCVRAAASAER